MTTAAANYTAARRPIDFLLGLPSLRDGALWHAARALHAPVLISANALSRWRIDHLGLRIWEGFETRWMHLIASHPVALDSAGFVSAAHYRGFPWSTEDCLDVAAYAPFLWFASQDWCVEPEIARDECAVLDRISGTVRLNIAYLNCARRRGVGDRFVPVIQGWRPEHYERCVERMPFVRDFPLVGVGSMCRRHVDGPDGILQVFDRLDDIFWGADVRLHLFGLKSQGIAHASTRPRVASCDSQAYGVAARHNAHRARTSKSDVMVARVMTTWYRKQSTPWPAQWAYAVPVGAPKGIRPTQRTRPTPGSKPPQNNSANCTSGARSTRPTSPPKRPTRWRSWTTD